MLKLSNDTNSKKRKHQLFWFHYVQSFLIYRLKIFLLINYKRRQIGMQKKQGNIKVFCRFRPFNRKQLQSHSQKLHRIANRSQLIIKDTKGDRVDEISFMFDQAFDVQSNQQEIFQQVGMPVLQNILDGFNGTIMAYGQTSSGKTHTMQGYDMNDKDAKGIMPRIIEKLFSAIQKSSESIEFKLKISIFQLYMQKIRDLLDVSKGDLKIRENKIGPYIENLTEVYVGDRAEVFKLIHLGQKNRITCATNMNEHSSRSHMIFLLSLNQFNNQDSSSKTSKLFLIDLAGSEKVSKTGAEGKMLEQAKKINLSLTNLGKVIKHLAQKHNHIPYRDSKLTRVLKDSLGGNSKTTLIVTCSPHEMHLPETISTLRFGENAQKIKNKPKINRQLTVQQLQKIVQKLELQVKAKDLKVQFLQKHIRQKLGAQLPDYKEISGLLNQLQKYEEERREGMSPTRQSSANNVQSSKEEEQPELMPQSSEETLNIIEEPISNQAQITLSKQAQSYYLTMITQLQQELSKANTSLSKQAQKYHQLKKEYTELHQNLTSILKENIELQQIKAKLEKQLNDVQQQLNTLEYSIALKQSSQQDHNQSRKSDSTENASLYESELENQLILNNSTLIKMIVGEIFSIIGPYQQQEIIKVIQNDHWYRKVIINGVNCVDFYEYQKQKMGQQIQQFIKKKQALQKNMQEEQNLKQRTISESKYCALLQQMRAQKQKQNQKIITLQNKLDKLFDEYHQMISLQTSWKAECQLYQRKLKKKEEKIQELQQALHQLSEQIEYLESNNYDDFEDSRSVRSKIVKPLKGGLLFK